MTRTTNARVAGFALLLYIAVGLTAMVLAGKAAGPGDAAARLASIAAHASYVRAAIVLDLAACVCALVLAVTLFAVTRDVDPDLALSILVFRSAEGVIGAVSLPRTLGRLWLATTAGADAPDPASAAALSAMLMNLPNWSATLSATFFALGSLAFTWLLVKGRLAPAGLAWLGLIASILLVVCLPLQLAGILRGLFTQLMWIPMALFEIPLGVLWLVKGVRRPA